MSEHLVLIKCRQKAIFSLKLITVLQHRSLQLVRGKVMTPTFVNSEREREKRQFREYQKMVPVVNVIKLFWRKSRFLQN